MTRTASSFKPPLSLRAWLGALALAQLAFWAQTSDIRPRMTVVPEPPSAASAHALALGDAQFYFRYQAFQLQNFGDGFGRVTPLKDYDFEKLYRWFTLLDTLDATSHYVPSVASYYYAQTQRAEDTRYVVDYLYEHSLRDTRRNWWWLAQAVYLARHRLNDLPRALEIAKVLAEVPGNLPIWARQLPAFILEGMGEKEAALAIMEGLLAHHKEIPPEEFRFMKLFIEERLGFKRGKTP